MRPFSKLIVLTLLATLAPLACGDDRARPRLLHSQLGAFDPLVAAGPEVAGAPDPTAEGQRAAYLVQFVGAVQPGWLAAVRAHGAQPRGYFPDDAWLVAATPAQAAALAADAWVRAVVLAPVALSIDPDLLVEDGAGGIALRADVASMDLVVEVADAGALPGVRAAIAAAGGRVVGGGGVVLEVRLDEAGVLAVAAHAEVMSVAPRPRATTTNDREYGLVQAGLAHASPFWDLGLRGAGQVVGIVDGGLDTASCRFSGNKVLAYVTQSFSGTPPAVTLRHGTHVAGIAAGDLNNDGAYQVEDGEAPAARLHFTAVGDPNDATGSSLLTPVDLTALLDSAYAAGARVHSDSWGSVANTYNAQNRSVDAYVAAHPDLAIFVAAGNDGPAKSTIRCPGSSKNVVTVSSYDAGVPGDISTDASHGPTGDGRLKPTVAAPGVSVASADYLSACGLLVLSGTSMATPAAAAAGALVREYFVEGFYPSGARVAANALRPSAALVKAVLVASTVEMAGARTDGRFPATGQGFGRIDLARAAVLGAAAGSDGLYVSDGAAALGQNGTFSAQFSLLGGSRLRAVLTWTDPAATAGAGVALVNDLDLSVTGPGGTYVGNAAIAGQATPNGGGSADRLNVEEMVNLDAAPAGAYTATVAAHNVPTGSQPFALVIVGRFAQRPDRGGPLAVQAAATADVPAAFAAPLPVADADAGAAAGGGGFADTAAHGCTAGGQGSALAALAALAAVGRSRRRAC